MSSVKGYCCRCRENVTVADAKRETAKNNRVMYKGKCGKCKSTTVCAFIKSESPKEEKPKVKKEKKEPKEPKEEVKKPVKVRVKKESLDDYAAAKPVKSEK